MKKNSRHPTNNEYTLEEKLKCVALMKDMGGLTKEAILACQVMLPSVSKDTLARWLRDYGPRVAPIASEIVQTEPDVELAKMSMTNKMLKGYDNLLNKMSDVDFVKNTTNVLHVATAIGIFEQRLRLAIGLSNEVVYMVKRFIAVLGRKGYDPMDVFEDMIEEYEKEPDVRASTVIDIAAEMGPQPTGRFVKGERRQRRQHGPGSR